MSDYQNKTSDNDDFKPDWQKLKEFELGELEEILQNEENQRVLNEMQQNSQLDLEEKEELEIELFGQTSSLKKVYEQPKYQELPIEALIEELHAELIKSWGKERELREKVSYYKEENKDLRNDQYAAIRQVEKVNRKLSKKRIAEGREQQFPLNGKIPPQAVELEEKVITSYFHHPEWMKEYSQAHLNLQFYKESNKFIHAGLMAKSTRPTINNVAEYLRKIERLAYVRGRYRIEELAKGEPATSKEEVSDYLKIIKQKYLQRKIIEFATNIINEVYDDKQEKRVQTFSIDAEIRANKNNKILNQYTDNKEKIEDYIEYIRDLSFRVRTLLPFKYRKKYSTKEYAKEILEETEKLIERGGKPVISTGYEKLDKVTHGIRPNKLFIVGARGKNGKTTFSLNIADNVAKQHKDAAFFSYEMSYKEILHKLIGKRANIDIEKFEYFDEENKFTTEEFEQVKEKTKEVIDLPMHIRAEKPKSLEYTIGECYNLKSMYPDLSLIVFDGLQAFEKIMPAKANRSYFFDHILTVMKALSDELNVTIIVNAQLKGEVETYKNRKPILS